MKKLNMKKVFAVCVIIALIILNGLASLDIKNYEKQIQGMEVELNNQVTYIAELEGEINDLEMEIEELNK